MASFSRALAVDLGASRVRILEIGPDSKGRPTILGMGEEEIVFDPAKTTDFFPVYSQALISILGRMSTKTRICHLCLGGPAVFSRILKIPVTDSAKIDSIIGFEAQQTVPAIEQALWDYQILPSAQPGETEGLILAIKKETVEEMCAASSAAGCKPLSVTLAPAALLNSFLFNYPEVSGVSLILDLGARASTICLIEGTRFFIRVVPVGAAAITQAVATDLQESFAGAETLKKAKGFVHPGGAYEDSPDAATARISKLARGVMTRLHAEIERSITFFRSQQGGGKPTRAWLAGGGIALAYTDLFFQEKLKIPVEFFQPFRRLALAGGLDGQSILRTFPGWTVAVGTALQAASDLPVRINVLGAAGRASAQKAKDFPALLLGGVFLALMFLLPGIHGFWQAAKIQARLASQTQRVDEASQALAKLDSVNQKFSSLVQRLELAQAIEEERIRWPRLLQELRKNVPPRLWITSMQVVPVPESEKAPPGPGKSPAIPPKILEIRGMFETQSEKADAEAVENFQKSLSQGGILQNVTVLEREAPQYRDGKTDQVALKF
ncbi:MAG: hypothetical protein EBT57_07735, partial [Verrucomicrobia bacterium]|nr:hypothetical protein [Verrucomicrobiota bacterium]